MKMNVDAMKYAELQGLAKELGLKANAKADKLRMAIKQHYEGQQLEDEQINANDGIDAQEYVDSTQTVDREEKYSTEESVVSTTLFVTSRRGKRTRTKISSGCATTKPSLTSAKEDESTALSGTGRSKRRSLSSVNESEPTESITELQPEVDTESRRRDKGNEPKVVRAGKIPRHEGLMKKNKASVKAFTPNFKKLHEANFKKMESIDSYVQRKSKQMGAFRNVHQDLQIKPSGALLMSPAVVSQRPAQRASVSAQREVPFRPSVLSTRRINVRFSEATQDNEHKRSLVKTPARLSACVAQSTPRKNSLGKANSTKSSNVSTSKTPGTFVFIGNTSFSHTPDINKPVFDLKASLSRPLSYKPHKGKLKPFTETKENTAQVPSHQKNYKQHQVETREERRAKQVADRRQKKQAVLGARRGLVMTDTSSVRVVLL